MKSKRYKKLPEKTNLAKPDTINNLIPIVKKNCTVKFDESIDLNILIKNKQKKNEVNLRTAVNLPGGTGKSIKVAVVAEESKQKDAKDSGADLVGGDSGSNAKITRQILDGKIGPKRDIVLLNSAAAIVAGGKAKNLEDGIKIATETIDSGKAKQKLEELVSFTNQK